MRQKKCLIIAIAVVILLSTPLASLSAAQSVAGSKVANIDVFTDKGGIGPNVSSGSYGPQELVQMYALVTYGNASIANQNVAFYVKNANGTLIATRVESTNLTGIASAEYRMPPSDPNGTETSLGVWSITGTVNVTQTTLSDTTNFTFGYLSGITNIQMPSTIQPLENLPIDVTITSLSNLTVWSELDITLFDHAQEPIGSYTTTNTQASQNATVNASIFVPGWAFLGQGTVDICLLSSDGTAIGTENTSNFQIVPNTGAVTTNAAPDTVFEAPEYAWGGLVALLACLVAFIVFTAIKKKGSTPLGNA